jgi:hypothetical protein
VTPKEPGQTEQITEASEISREDLDRRAPPDEPQRGARPVEAEIRVDE